MGMAVSIGPRRLLLGFGALLATTGTGCGAAVALGGAMDTSGNPDIADHAIVVASALTWLKNAAP